jgi:hypothetical protein
VHTSKAEPATATTNAEFDQEASFVKTELAGKTPDLGQIGLWLNDLKGFLTDEESRTKFGVTTSAIAASAPGDTAVVAAMKQQIATLTDQFDRLGGWGVAMAQHKVLTSGGKWNWVTLGTNPDLNPGGPTFTGTTSPRGSGCAPGQTFIIGVGCV